MFGNIILTQEICCHFYKSNLLYARKIWALKTLYILSGPGTCSKFMTYCALTTPCFLRSETLHISVWFAQYYLMNVYLSSIPNIPYGLYYQTTVFIANKWVYMIKGNKLNTLKINFHKQLMNNKISIKKAKTANYQLLESQHRS